MKDNRLRFATFACLVVLTTGCKQEEKPNVARETVPSSASAKAAGTENPNSVKIKETKGSCTFEFESPEALPKADGKSGPTNVVFETKSLRIEGYDGVTIYREASDQLKLLPSEFQQLEQNDNINGLIFTVGVNPKPSQEDATAVRAALGEKYTLDRPIGCLLSCWGSKSRQADVINICKNAKITSTNTEPK